MYASVSFALTAVILSALAGCKNSPTDPGQADIDAVVASVTDLGTINQGDKLEGRDGGYSGVVGGRSTWVFGDTVIKSLNAAGKTWLSNSWSTTTDTNAGDGIDALQAGIDASGQPMELLDFTDAEQQFNTDHSGEDCREPCGARWALWPGSLVRDDANQRALLFYGKIKALPGELNFRGVGQSLAVWPDDQPRPERLNFDTVENHPTMLFGETELAYGHASTVHNGMLYAYACNRRQLVKPCRLARVALATALNKASWQYYSLSEGWQSDPLPVSELFFGGDIMSVNYNAFLDRFVAFYNPATSHTIAMRTAVTPEGPWSKEVKVADAMASTNTNGWVYDTLAHKEFEQLNGQRVFLTYTRHNESNQREMRLLQVDLEKPVDLDNPVQ